MKCYYLQENKIINLSSNYQIKSQVPYTNQKFDYYISKPWIDSHTHCNYLNSEIKTIPDEIGVFQGVGYIIDSGSTGIENFSTWETVNANSKTQILPLLNISKKGIILTGELKDLANMSTIDEVKQVEAKISGFKLRLSPTVTNDYVTTLKHATELAQYFNKPLQIHIGNKPPKIEYILKHINKHVILTHCYNNKSNNLFQSPQLIKALKSQIKQGVIIDVGHGSESFAFDIAKKAITNKLAPFLISTDLHDKNKQNGPVFSLACTMSKMLHIGQDLKSIIDAVTINPQQIFQIKNYPMTLNEGFTLFKIINKNVQASDGQKDKVAKQVMLKKILVPILIKHQNNIFKVKKEGLYGKSI